MSTTWLMLAAFFASAAATIASAWIYKWWRNRRGRLSPLSGKRIGYVPGQQLIKRSRDKQDEGLLGFMMAYFSIPLALLAWALKRVPSERMTLEPGDWVLIVFGAALLFYSLRYMIKSFREVSRIEDGLLAERVTGMQLNRLISSGCIVMHDLPGEGFNIDHVVIAPRGVYAVETKSFRKPKEKGEDGSRVTFDGRALHFPDFINTQALEQAERQAQWLARDIRQGLGMEVRVVPALALPGWFVMQDEAIWRRPGVKVFTPMGDGCNFMSKGAEALDATQRSLIAKALALRYPKIDDRPATRDG